MLTALNSFFAILLFAFSQELTMSVVKKFLANESGATAIEYGLIAALIAVVVITALTNIGTSLSTQFAAVAGSLR
jgi:pilus assembly protein Flp/PilA